MRYFLFDFSMSDNAISDKKQVLSPHLSVHKWFISSFASIFGRACGVVSFVVLLVLTLFVVFSVQSSGFASFVIRLVVMPFVSTNILVKIISHAVVFSLLFSVIFYLTSLVRHTMWDFASCLSSKCASTSSIIALAFSFLASVAIMVAMFL